MSRSHHPAHTPPHGPAQRRWRIGCVSYLNALPLIAGLDAARVQLHFDVPANLLDMLQNNHVDLALCPVIDYFRNRDTLSLVPAGGIGSEGPTLTVRLFSRVPVQDLQRVHVDADSHTSVALLQVLLARAHNLEPELIRTDARAGHPPDAQAVLLIGDKVITAAPPRQRYPHQVDLGQWWHELTGLPFVFATWMARADAELGELPDILAAQRQANATQIPQIARLHAPRHGWPVDRAAEYLGQILRYQVAQRELEAIERFGELAEAVAGCQHVHPSRA